jgi:hypothetical protein
MAMSLRLPPDAESALRAEAERTGRSQQDIIREALDRHLQHVVKRQVPSQGEQLVASGKIRPPRTPYRKVTPYLELPEGSSSLDLLDREDRL